MNRIYSVFDQYCCTIGTAHYEDNEWLSMKLNEEEE